MKQRRRVALALLRAPEGRLRDDPAHGLDPAGIVEMRDLMHNLSASGKTVFISSHLLTEVQQICTRVAIIHLGKLITESTVADLTRGQGDFRVTLDQTQAQPALTLVKAQAWGEGARIDGEDALITRAPGNSGRALNV